MLLNECRDGTFQYPESISLEQYKQYKSQVEPSAMQAFVGFGCSFAGKWYGGYAREGNTGHKQDYTRCAVNSLKRKVRGFEGCEFLCDDYRNLNPSGKLIYCDPPYVGTTKIFRGGFDSNEFWNIMRKWSDNNIVIISEYTAPADFECVLEIETKTNIRGKDSKKIPRVERLFRLN